VGQSDNRVLDDLSSNDEGIVVDALFRLSGLERDFVPSEKLVTKVLSLIQFNSLEVVDRAIFLLGMRWKVEASLRPILKILTDKTAPEPVRRTACSAAASLGERFPSQQELVERTLLHEGLDIANPVDVRASALLEAARLRHLISPKEYGKLAALEAHECLQAIEAIHRA